MLNIIRDNVQSFGVKFVVAIVVLVMAFFGISTYRSQSSNTIASVDGYEIKLDKYSRVYENAREEIRQQYGTRADEYLEMVNLKAQIIQRLTNNALLLKSASENGLAVSDKELAYEIYHNPAFMTDQRFDPRKYENALRNMRMDKLAYERSLREELLTRKYFQFVGSGALFSRKSIANEYKRFDSEMEIKVIELDPTLFDEQVSVTDEEIKEYYSLHKSQFQQKSQVALRYFVLSINDAKNEVKVRDKEVSKYYELHKDDEFTNKESFLSRHILISAPSEDEAALQKAGEKAEMIYRQLKKYPDKFSEFAEQYSDDPGSAQKGGDLGWVEKGTFVSEFENAVENLEKNEISKPFQSSFGFHIVELLDTKGESVQPFDEVKQEIENTIRLNKAKRRLNNKVARMFESPDVNSIEDLAQQEGKEVEQTELFDDSAQLEDLGYTYQLYQEVKDSSEKEMGKYNLPGEDKIVVYQVAEKKESYIKPLDEVREQARYYALEAKKKEFAQEKLNKFATEINSLKEFDNLASTLNTKAIRATFRFSDEQIEDLNVTNQFKVDVLKMENGQVKAVRDNERGYLVYMIDKQPGRITEENEQQLVMLENMLQKQKSEVVLTGFIKKMRKEVEIEYNGSLLNALDVRLDS